MGLRFMADRFAHGVLRMASLVVSSLPSLSVSSLVSPRRLRLSFFGLPTTSLCINVLGPHPLSLSPVVLPNHRLWE